MKQKFLNFGIAAAAILFTNTPSFSQTTPGLKVGDDAPKIAYAKWVKGEPLDIFQKGKVYVVEFWATWCGPCRAAMPHLSHLANKYKNDATVVSFNVHELAYSKDKTLDYVEKAEKFVQSIGSGMDYGVAIDTKEEAMWNNWIVPTGFLGIPQSFIIDREGKIAWMGHPSSIEPTLKLIIDNNYNAQTKAALESKRKNESERFKTLMASLKTARESKDYLKSLAIIDEVLTFNETASAYMNQLRYELLFEIDPEKAEKFGKELLVKFSNDPLALLSVSGAILERKPTPKPHYALALEMAVKAAEKCAPDDRFALANLAKAYYKTGNVAKAVALQKKVVEITNNNKFVEHGEEAKKKEQEQLTEYLKNEKK